MEPNKQYFRCLILFFYFRNGRNKYVATYRFIRLSKARGCNSLLFILTIERIFIEFLLNLKLQLKDTKGSSLFWTKFMTKKNTRKKYNSLYISYLKISIIFQSYSVLINLGNLSVHVRNTIARVKRPPIYFRITPNSDDCDVSRATIEQSQ